MYFSIYGVAALVSVTVLRVSRYARRNKDRKGIAGVFCRLVGKIPAAAAPIVGAAIVIAAERIHNRPKPLDLDEEDRELERLRHRLEMLAVVSPENAVKATERTKLDLRLKSLGFEELPSSELDIIFDAVQNLSDVEGDTDYQELELAKQRVDAMTPEQAQAQELDKLQTQWEISEAQELYKVLKALNQMAAEMEDGQRQQQEIAQPLVDAQPLEQGGGNGSGANIGSLGEEAPEASQTQRKLA